MSRYCFKLVFSRKSGSVPKFSRVTYVPALWAFFCLLAPSADILTTVMPPRYFFVITSAKLLSRHGILRCVAAIGVVKYWSHQSGW